VRERAADETNNDVSCCTAWPGYGTSLPEPTRRHVRSWSKLTYPRWMAIRLLNPLGHRALLIYSKTRNDGF
jgi:hypothetical protein